MKPLPWGFYIDVLTLVGTGMGLMLGILLKSIPMITYHAGFGLAVTWHLGELIRKFSLQLQNEHKEP